MTMSFQAIVHAPALRQGARLNIADLDQSKTLGPKRIGLGAEVELRFGVCCPDLARAIVVDYTPQPESAVIAVAGEEITICHRSADAGVSQPGLESETWFVA
jgi:hypothetical protein